jgi:hypothetical protein
MDKVKAGLRGLSAEQKASRAAIVYNALHGNPDYPDPSPSLSEFHEAYLELKAANLAAMDRGRMACARKRKAAARIDAMMSRLAAYVNSTAMGDTTKLLGSGFFFVKRPKPISSLEQPQNLQVKPTRFPNQLEIKWEGVAGARIYQVEVAIGMDTTLWQWERVSLCTRPKVVVENTRPQPVFRVCAVGTKASSPYSAEVQPRIA